MMYVNLYKYNTYKSLVSTCYNIYSTFYKSGSLDPNSIQLTKMK